jgi:tetraacyldisaccharide 4'-kinase
MKRTSEAPPFWWEPADWRGRLLRPASWIYGRVATNRLKNGPREKLDVPVFCVGNFTVGGSGKTPVVIAIAEAARALGQRPGILSRGYGADIKGARLVDAAHDSAQSAGDEPLLLARHTPVAVGPDRVRGASLLTEQGVDFIIMDDGFQSARLHMDFALIVVDAHRGLGNGQIIPGGPLRAPMIEQIRYCDALLVMGDGDGAAEAIRYAARAAKPIRRGRLETHPVPGLEGRKVLAFAGIGDPEKFFRSVAAAGAELTDARPFADHHPYSDAELMELGSEAASRNLTLVTTEKDAARLVHGTSVAREFLARITVLPVAAIFSEPDMAASLIRETLSAFRARRVAAIAGGR